MTSGIAQDVINLINPRNTKNKEMTDSRIKVLSKRIHMLEDLFADIVEKHGMWSQQADRCYEIIKKANEELVSLYKY